jgi:antitoxin (DNA-binding transcriptional repressor) of toxin-antitoxin stability system
MKSIGIDEFKSHIDQYLSELQSAAYVITAGGQPVAAVVPVSSDGEIEELLLAVSPRLRQILEDAAKRFEAGQGIPRDEFWRLVESGSGGEDLGRPSSG